MNSIGEKIKAIRLDNNLRQIDFAKAICVSQSHLSNIESGQDYPSKAVIRLIALQFGIDEEYLKGDNNEIDS